MAKASRVQSRIQQQLDRVEQKLDELLARDGARFAVTAAPVPTPAPNSFEGTQTGDNPYLTPEELEKLKAEMKPNSFESQYQNVPPVADESTTPDDKTPAAKNKK